MYVKAKKRQTRRESQDATREQLVTAAGKLFVRVGFEAASVERITVEAGFSRGAFYSNFRSKDELFIAVLDKIRREISGEIEQIFRSEDDPARRLEKAREWYIRQKLTRDWAILETEFDLRALRNHQAKRRLAELQKQGRETYSALVATHFSETDATGASSPEVVALALLAIVKGLSALSLLESGDEDIATQCRRLVFDKLIPSEGVTGESKRGRI